MPIKPILRRISPLVDKNTASKLHLHAQQSSVQRRLTQEQLAIIYQEKWFKMFVPIQFNGLELSLIEGLKLQEQLAYIDGSLGWTVTLCSGACMFFGYLSLDVSHDLFKDEKVCFAGSGQATGVAVRTKKGYKISGDWKYATGADLATIFTVNCQIVENGQYLRNQDGSLQIASFFLLRKDVQIEDDWQAFGLEATGSFGFKAKNVKVGKENIFYIHPAYSQHPQLEYRFPFLQFAESTLAVNHLGMILRFLDLCKDRLYRYPKKNESIHNEAENLLENITNKSKMLKNNFYRAVKAAYQELKDNGSISEKRLQSISVNSKKMVRDLRMGVYLLYPYCGMQATNENSETNRIWRNLFTASQHSLLM